MQVNYFLKQRYCKRWITLGIVKKTFGCNGCLFINYLYRRANIIRKGIRVLLKKKNKVKIRVKCILRNSKVCFKMIRNKNIAQSFTQSRVFIEEKKINELETSKMYLFNLLSAKSYRNSGYLLGNFFSFFSNSVQISVKIKLINYNVLCIPFINTFIKKIGRKNNFIIFYLLNELINT